MGSNACACVICGGEGIACPSGVCPPTCAACARRMMEVLCDPTTLAAELASDSGERLDDGTPLADGGLLTGLPDDLFPDGDETVFLLSECWRQRLGPDAG